MERKNKKDFKLYLDSLACVDEMTDEEAGELLKAFIAFWREEEIKIKSGVKFAFKIFEAQFKRDFENYKKICQRNANNGGKGGRPITQTNPNKPTGFSGFKKNPNEPDTDTDTDKDKDKDTDNKNTGADASASDFEKFWNQYQKKTGRAKCEAKWNRMVTKEREAALKSVAAYVASTPNVTYRKDPLTWLNGKHWEDELSQIQTQKTDAEYKAELEQMGGNAFREKYRLLYEEPLPHTVKDVKERADLKHMKLYFRISRLFEE